MKRRLDLLEKLCVLLESLPPEKFDYGVWASCGDLHACGTTACALGWATTIPEAGLSVDSNGVIACGDEAFASAGAAAFGLTRLEAEALFLWDEKSPVFQANGPKIDASAREVATWIRRHIEAWRAEAAQ